MGGNYHGSQWQPNVRTIQGELIDAFTKWSGNQYSMDMIVFSGRTDKGVNSLGQLIYLACEKPLNLDKINSYLPDDIILWAYAETSPRFNPRYDILSRHYRYYLSTIGTNLHLERIRKAASYLIGTHDYRFLSKPDNGRNTIATLLGLSVIPQESKLVIDVYGISFLWKLVRKIVTLLVLIGAGHHPPEIVHKLLEGGEVVPGGIEPAPSEGLVLIEAIVPYRFKSSKNAIARIRKKIAKEKNHHGRHLSMLDGIATDHLSNGRLCF